MIGPSGQPQSELQSCLCIVRKDTLAPSLTTHLPQGPVTAVWVPAAGSYDRTMASSSGPLNEGTSILSETLEYTFRRPHFLSLSQWQGGSSHQNLHIERKWGHGHNMMRLRHLDYSSTCVPSQQVLQPGYQQLTAGPGSCHGLLPHSPLSSRVTMAVEVWHVGGPDARSSEMPLISPQRQSGLPDKQGRGQKGWLFMTETLELLPSR